MGVWGRDGVDLGGGPAPAAHRGLSSAIPNSQPRPNLVPCVAPAAGCLTLLHPCWPSHACVPQDLKMIFGTREGTTIIFPGTGTGGWESALTNTLSPGDKVRGTGV